MAEDHPGGNTPSMVEDHPSGDAVPVETPGLDRERRTPLMAEDHPSDEAATECSHSLSKCSSCRVDLHSAKATRRAGENPMGALRGSSPSMMEPRGYGAACLHCPSPSHPAKLQILGD